MPRSSVWTPKDDRSSTNSFGDVVRRCCTFSICCGSTARTFASARSSTQNGLLRSVVCEQSSALLYADHIEQHGIELFRLTCDRDFEGVVAKWKDGAYGQSWFKI